LAAAIASAGETGVQRIEYAIRNRLAFGGLK
jgi:hypothetical protein